MKGDEVTDLRSRVEALPWTPQELAGIRREWTEHPERFSYNAGRWLALLDQPAPPDTALPAVLERVASALNRVLGTEGEDNANERELRSAIVALAALATAPTPPDPTLRVRACPDCGAVGLADGPVEHATAPTPPDGLDAERLADALSMAYASPQRIDPSDPLRGFRADAEHIARAYAATREPAP
jgi:hypothetical protein